MDQTFFDGLHALYQHAKFGEDRTMRASCRCENVMFVTSRMPQSSKLPALNLLTGQKIRFFALQGHLVAPIHVKLRRADGQVGPLGCAKFHLNRDRGWQCGPQNIKKNLPMRGD